MPVPVTRKCGETNETLHAKFQSHRQVTESKEDNMWETTSHANYASGVTDGYIRPPKNGVMADKKPAEITSVKFTGTTGNSEAYTMDAENTKQYWTKPQRQPASVLAVQAAKPKRVNPKKGKLNLPMELLYEERDRLAALEPLESIDCANVKPNIPGYTGHEPKSPKNVRGPYMPNTLTSAGQANAIGLGMADGPL